jgi:hypothetical protein
MQAPSVFIIGAAVGGLFLAAIPAFGQGTAFTYQGRLNANSSPATGNYDLRFKLFLDPLANNQAGGTLLTNAVPVANGLFIVTLDFGPGIFTGTNYWLEVDVKTNGASSYVNLSPLQEVTPAPYAIFAENIATGGLPAGAYVNAVTFSNAANQFSGAFIGNGVNLTNVNAARLGGLSTSNFWQTGGNSGTSPTNGNFLGTTDNQPLELRVNRLRAMRLEPGGISAYALSQGFPASNGAPNVIGGSPVNFVPSGVVGATIGGGGTTNYGGPSYTNTVGADFGFIGGGFGNNIQFASSGSIIGGGVLNTIETNASSSVIVGGYGNTVQSNTSYGIIVGGTGNTVGEPASGPVIVGGFQNTNQGTWSIVGAGYDNVIQNCGDDVIGGGELNTIQTFASDSVIGGGSGNVVQPEASYATVPGGFQNTASASYTFAAGQRAKAINSGSFVWADSQNADFSSTANDQFLIRAQGGAGIGTSQTPPGGLRVHTGGLAVTGGSSPNYGTAKGVFLEGTTNWGVVFAFDYNAFAPMPLLLNSPGGNVGIGTTAPAFTLTVNGSAGKPGGGSWSDTSDARLKKRIEPLRNALDKLTELHGVTFDWVNPADHANQTGRQTGFLAQQVERVFPDWIKEVPAQGADKTLTHDGKVKTINLPFAFDALMVESLRELRDARNEADKRMNRMETELKRAQAENAELKQRLDSLEQILRAPSTNVPAHVEISSD